MTLDSSTPAKVDDMINAGRLNQRLRRRRRGQDLHQGPGARGAAGVV
jgi:hypothetical protein